MSSESRMEARKRGSRARGLLSLLTDHTRVDVSTSVVVESMASQKGREGER